MKKITTATLVIGIVFTGLIISGCTDSKQPGQSYGPVVPPVTTMDVAIGEVLSNPLAYDNIRITGTVNRTIDVSGYTYLEVTDTTGSIWVAGYTTRLDNDSRITATGSLMTNFLSPTLNRTFDVILFANEISDGTISLSNSPHGSDNTIIGDINITPVAGGTRIEDILADPGGLSGKEVKVAAVVVKNVGLINETFLTLDDGTGQLKAKCPDSFVVSKGDNVVVKGTVMTDVDLGSGYHYDVLLQITEVEYLL